LSFISLKISLYDNAFIFQMSMNFLLYSISCATYSRKSEKGGFDITMSASFKSAIDSSLLKSQLLLRDVFIASLKSIFQSLFKSSHLVISNL